MGKYVSDKYAGDHHDVSTRNAARMDGMKTLT
jgi:hypothetical protein